MKRLILAAAMLLLAGNASAQTTMAFLITPAEIGTHDALRPKYVHTVTNTFEAHQYGIEHVMFAAAPLTPEQRVSIASNIDVIMIPANLDATISAIALSQVKSALEGLQIPAGWVTTANTYRQVCAVVLKFFAFMNRFEGLFQRTFFEAGITLDTRINQLTQAQRDALTLTATSLGLDVSGITGPMLVRQALKLLGDQLPSVTVMGEVF